MAERKTTKQYWVKSPKKRHWEEPFEVEISEQPPTVKLDGQSKELFMPINVVSGQLARVLDGIDPIEGSLMKNEFPLTIPMNGQQFQRTLVQIHR